MRGQGQTGRGSPEQALYLPPPPQMGRKSVKSVLWVSADGLRVVDDKTKVGGWWGWEWVPLGAFPHPAQIEAENASLPTCRMFLPQGPSRLCHVLLQRLGTPYSHNSELSPAVTCELA